MDGEGRVLSRVVVQVARTARQTPTRTTSTHLLRRRVVFVVGQEPRHAVGDRHVHGVHLGPGVDVLHAPRLQVLHARKREEGDEGVDSLEGTGKGLGRGTWRGKRERGERGNRRARTGDLAGQARGQKSLVGGQSRVHARRRHHPTELTRAGKEAGSGGEVSGREQRERDTTRGTKRGEMGVTGARYRVHWRGGRAW